MNTIGYQPTLSLNFTNDWFLDLIVLVIVIVFVNCAALGDHFHYSSKQQVRTTTSVTAYGSQFDDGRLSSR